MFACIAATRIRVTLYLLAIIFAVIVVKSVFGQDNSDTFPLRWHRYNMWIQLTGWILPWNSFPLSPEVDVHLNILRNSYSYRDQMAAVRQHHHITRYCHNFFIFHLPLENIYYFYSFMPCPLRTSQVGQNIFVVEQWLVSVDISTKMQLNVRRIRWELLWSWYRKDITYTHRITITFYDFHTCIFDYVFINCQIVSQHNHSTSLYIYLIYIFSYISFAY